MSPIRAPFDTPTAVFGIPSMSPKEPTLSWWLDFKPEVHNCPVTWIMKSWVLKDHYKVGPKKQL